MALKNVKINGVTYEAGEINVPLADDQNQKAKFLETSDGNLNAAKMAKGISGYSGGELVQGTADVNGTINKTLDASNTSYTVPAGFVDGGQVSIVPETKTVTPSKSAQDITPTAGKVLSKVSVAKIPDTYQDVSSVNATAADVKSGKKIVSTNGTVVTGTHTDPSISLTNGVLSIS